MAKLHLLVPAVNMHTDSEPHTVMAYDFSRSDVSRCSQYHVPVALNSIFKAGFDTNLRYQTQHKLFPLVLAMSATEIAISRQSIYLEALVHKSI